MFRDSSREESGAKFRRISVWLQVKLLNDITPGLSVPIQKTNKFLSFRIEIRNDEIPTDRNTSYCW